MGRVSRSQCTDQILLVKHVQMVLNREDPNLTVEMIFRGSKVAAHNYAKPPILNCLEALDICGFSIGCPNWGTVREGWLDEGIKGQGQGLFVETKRIVTYSSHDVKALVAFMFILNYVLIPSEVGVPP